MNTIRLILMASMVAFMVFLTGPASANGQTPTPGATAETETIKGIIDYNTRLGGYFIRGVEPGGESYIVNQNTALLKKLKASGKTVTIQGYTTEQGAEYFFIESIDGEKYTTAGKSKPKPIAK
jgi:hypothetical protein